MVETIWRRRWTREALPAAEMIARQPADRRLAQGLAASRDLQRAAGDGDPDPRIRWPALDYPNFEVIVIDNNTKDPAVWRPVQDYCAQLGERFRFFHFDVMKGFKAGALNYVLSQTAPDAEVIGVIDSDYMVRPDWLKARGAVLRRRQDRLRAVPAGPSRLDRRPLQGNAELGICRLLRHRHVPAQRIRRHHPARHHDPGAPRPAWRRWAAGRPGASPRTPSSACA